MKTQIANIPSLAVASPFRLVSYWSPYILGRAFGCVSLLSLAMCSSATPLEEATGTLSAALDDNENTAPAQWWTYTAQTATDVNNTIQSLNARIVDIKVDNLSPYPFTVTYVQNTGTYAKQWWWYNDIDFPTLQQNVATNKARLVSLKAYDTGDGKVLYSAAMISNSGADQKAWWYYAGISAAQVAANAQSNNARVTAVQSYVSNGQTLYAVIMIANTGADAKAWWWYSNVPTSQITSAVSTNNARILDVSYAGNGNFNVAMESCGNGGCPSWWWYTGQTYAATLALAATNGARVITADTYPGCDGYCFDTVMIGGSSGTNHGAPPNKLRGFVDLHTHPLSNLGFGGKLVYGGVDVGSTLPADPDCNGNAIAASVEQALGHDESTHGGFNLVNNGCGDDLREKVIHGVQMGTQGASDPSSNADGAPDFNQWPVWNDITHQKMWVDWIRRSYNGGQRVLVALAVNNKTLGDSTAGPGDYPTDDVDSADKQIEAIKAFVLRHSTGTNDNFMEVAYTSSDVQRIVQENKLAVVVGVEIDAIGNFYNSATNDQISTEIDRLYGEGVRYIFPIHILDNAFGGTAVYEGAFNYSNNRESGHWWNVICSQPGDFINFAYAPSFDLGVAAAEAFKLHDLLQPALEGAAVDGLVGATIAEGLSIFSAALQMPPQPPACAPNAGLLQTGNVNAQGLTTSGVFAIQEMMRHGMLIDVDHMSQLSMNAALQIGACVPGGYPLNSGHSNIRTNPSQCPSGPSGCMTTERNPSSQQYAEIGDLHGMSGIGSANTNAINWTESNVRTLQAMSVRAGTAFGTDMDGLAMSMPPTGGPKAQGTPATMLPGGTNNQQHVFFRNALNEMAHVFFDTTSGRHGETWSGAASAVNASPPAGNPATMLPGGTNNQQHIFYRDTSNNMEHVFFDASSGRHAEVWGSGAGSPTLGTAAAGDPATMTPGGTNNQQHIFYRDSNNNMEHVFFDSSSGLHAEVWGSGAGSPTLGPAAAGNPATMTPGGTNNQQHIFYRDLQGNMQHVFFDPSSGRHAEVWGRGAGSATLGTAAAGDPATMTPGGTNNQQHIFYRDTNNNIEHVFFDPSSGMHAELWGANAAGTPATMLPGGTNNQQHIFYRDLQGNIKHVFFDPGSGSRTTELWAGPGSPNSVPPAAGDPATMTPGGTNNQQHIFFVDTSGNLEHVFFDPSTGMHSELWAGGTLVSASPNGATGDYVAPIQYGPAFAPSQLGTRTWNYNYDGVAHYGMLPDFLQAVRGVPTGADLVDNNLMYGAQYFYDTWKLAETQSTHVVSGQSSCTDGITCSNNNQCASFVCAGDACQPPPCSPACNQGAPCGANGDCGSQVCSEGLCSPPACSPICTGGPCNNNGDCASFVCTGNTCQPVGSSSVPACSPSCSNGTTCSNNNQCSSFVCAGGACQPPSCSPICNQGASCGANGDCGSKVCSGGTCKAPACSPKCTNGSPCNNAGDCASSSCVGEVCSPPPNN